MDLSRHLPGFIQARLAGRTVVKRVIANSGWMYLDQSWRVLLGLAVGVWMARYLGPERFGRLNYAVAFVSMGAPLASLGLSGLLVRDFVRAGSTEAGVMLGTALMMKLTAGVVVALGCVLAAFWMHPGDPATIWLIAAVACGALFQCLDTLDSWWQAGSRFGVSAAARMAGATVAAAFKVTLILIHAPLLPFAIVGTAETLFFGVGWLAAYLSLPRKAGCWRWSHAQAVSWLWETWPIILMGLAVQVQAQIDLVIMGRLLPAAQLGNYAGAIRIVTVLAFIPVVLQGAAGPEIARAKMDGEEIYRDRLHRLYRGIMVVCILGIAPLVLAPRLIVRLLLGASFAGAAPVLPVLAFRLLLTGFGVARSLFITNDRLFGLALVGAVTGACTSVVLNLVLIPLWGVWGAVATGLVSFSITTFAFDAVVPALRPNLRLMMCALVMPWRSRHH
jgi:O-antigen/teichoic acid export membrane protein